MCSMKHHFARRLDTFEVSVRAVSPLSASRATNKKRFQGQPAYQCPITTPRERSYDGEARPSDREEKPRG